MLLGLLHSLACATCAGGECGNPPSSMTFVLRSPTQAWQSAKVILAKWQTSAQRSYLWAWCEDVPVEAKKIGGNFCLKAGSVSAMMPADGHGILTVRVVVASARNHGSYSVVEV